MSSINFRKVTKALPTIEAAAVSEADCRTGSYSELRLRCILLVTVSLEELKATLHSCTVSPFFTGHSLLFLVLGFDSWRFQEPTIEMSSIILVFLFLF